MDQKQRQALITRYLQGTCSPEESAALETWYLTRTEDTLDELPEPNYEKLEDHLWKHIQTSITPGVQQPRGARILSIQAFRYIAAAVILVVVSAGVFIYMGRFTQQEIQVTRKLVNIPPGGNRAYLTLSDGKRIDLTSAKMGEVADQSGIAVSKTAEGQLIYTINDQKSDGELRYNTIETPRGGQYQIHLPDGTKVWLNAESSLKYPVSFASQKERRVELSGEGYFEVAKNAASPFRVVGGKQTVEVLGTHFNINSYANEPTVKTTLIEGSVKVTGIGSIGNKTIKPGEQAVLDGSALSLTKADIDAEMAWKNGDFIFRDESIQSVMRKIARWYDVEVIYQDNDITSGFGGTISRTKNIAAVLLVLEETGGVHFKVTGRRVTVMK